jgi:hypothetical protein
MFQRFLLPFLAAGRRLKDDVFNPVEKFWPVNLQPAQDVRSQSPVMRAGFNQVES